MGDDELQLDSRALASLRRDEQRSWQRAPGARDAYIAPALNEDGSANPRWITNSAWGKFKRRIVASGETERLLNLQKILTLAGRRGTRAEMERPRRPSDAGVERYAAQLLDIEPMPPSTTGDDARAWRLRARRAAEKLIGEMRRDDAIRAARRSPRGLQVCLNRSSSGSPGELNPGQLAPLVPRRLRRMDVPC